MDHNSQLGNDEERGGGGVLVLYYNIISFVIICTPHPTLASL